jgi:hypothetical protein
MKRMKDEAPGVPHLLYNSWPFRAPRSAVYARGSLCGLTLRQGLACLEGTSFEGRAGGALSRPTGLPTRQHATACVLYGPRIAGAARAEGDRSRTPTDSGLRSPAPVSAGSVRQVRSPGLSTRNGTSMARVLGRGILGDGGATSRLSNYFWHSKSSDATMRVHRGAIHESGLLN